MTKYLMLSILLLAAWACKGADFAATQRRGSESNLELGKNSANSGRADASDGGLDFGGDADGSGGDNDGGYDADGGNDSGGGKDSGSDGRDADGGSDSDDGDDGDDLGNDGNGDLDGEDDLFIGDDAVDDDDEDGELDEDEDEITGEQAILKIKGLRRDSNDAPMLIVRRGNNEKRIAWPAKGQTVEIEGICDHKDVEIEIETELRGETFRPSQSQCFIAKENGDNSWHVGFEHDCNSNDFNKIDDTIATFTCSISDFEIEDIAINNGIPMGDWID